MTNNVLWLQSDFYNQILRESKAPLDTALFISKAYERLFYLDGFVPFYIIATLAPMIDKAVKIVRNIMAPPAKYKVCSKRTPIKEKKALTI